MIKFAQQGLVDKVLLEEGCRMMVQVVNKVCHVLTPFWKIFNTRVESILLRLDERERVRYPKLKDKKMRRSRGEANEDC
jgi:hypothetical protein